MQGLMMEYPLTLTHFLERARRLFPKKEIVSKMPGGALHRYTYADMTARAARLANALKKLGVAPGERVATFGWNSYRHLETYFAIPCSGAVLHTLNIRLFPDDVSYIANHAEDKVVIVDASLLPAFEKIAPQLKTVEQYIVMADAPFETSLPNALDYETLLAESSPDFEWQRLDEQSAAAMCYTSGTTGKPKGCAYSHRALFLHALGAASADSLGISERDVALPIVPMFHVFAWGVPFAATMVGAKQVFAGPNMQPQDIAELIQNERVTIAAGVPTIWIGLLAFLEREQYDLSSLRVMPVGGAAAPPALIETFQKKFGVQILHAWGMTEMSPLGTVARVKPEMLALPEAEQFRVRFKQGRPVAGVEIRAVDEAGNEVAWDGATMGELEVRGPWIIRAYYNSPGSEDRFHDGWFRTGDVVTIDADGYIQIVDRTKDLVKSGGEWISTVELESAIMGHPKVLEAAVIAVPHAKWQERPLACVVPKPDSAGQISKEEILEYLQTKFAKWWLPDDVVFIDQIPKTSVGKFDKKVLREKFKEYALAE
ncbi:MAG: long-chain fatty acid--CoA ligase [Chloroflexi bacterium]|nr:long-chain fatty acid--CoA ligase [Chloroflexota bacterium]